MDINPNHQKILIKDVGNMYKIKLAGIYMISNINTGEYYIGMSVDIFSRWQSHYNDLKMNKHSSKKLQELFNNSKITDFRFEVLSYISKTDIKNKFNVKGKQLDVLMRRILLQEEKNLMNKYSRTYSLNQNNKHFS